MFRRTVAFRRAKPGIKYQSAGEARRLRFGVARLRRQNPVNLTLKKPGDAA